MIATLIIGLIAGWLAGILMRGSGYGIVIDILLGLIGAVIGGWIFGALGIVAIGGVDAESNWITTSQIRNSAKGAWTLEELGWKEQPPGELTQWDGLMGHFVEYFDNNPPLAEQPYLKTWRDAVTACEANRAKQSG